MRRRDFHPRGRRYRRSLNFSFIWKIIPFIASIGFLYLAHLNFKENSVNAFFTRLVYIPYIETTVTSGYYWIIAFGIAGILFYVLNSIMD